MSKEQAIKNAQSAFIEALDAGVEEVSLIAAIHEAMAERELCIDATKMVNKLFEADSRWLTRLAEEEIEQRYVNEAQSTHT